MASFPSLPQIPSSITRIIPLRVFHLPLPALHALYHSYSSGLFNSSYLILSYYLLTSLPASILSSSPSMCCLHECKSSYHVISLLKFLLWLLTAYGTEPKPLYSSQGGRVTRGSNPRVWALLLLTAGLWTSYQASLNLSLLFRKMLIRIISTLKDFCENPKRKYMESMSYRTVGDWKGIISLLLKKTVRPVNIYSCCLFSFISKQSFYTLPDPFSPSTLHLPFILYNPVLSKYLAFIQIYHALMSPFLDTRCLFCLQCEFFTWVTLPHPSLLSSKR